MSIKIPTTNFPVTELIKNRWSARSFSNEVLTKENLLTIVEAGSWAFSANNEQPWRFLVAAKGDHDYEKILKSLMPGNTPWAKNAAGFIVGIAKTDFDKEGNPPNSYADHDLGAANATMALQACSMNIFCHPMAGFDKQVLSDTFDLPQNLKPMTVMALGYLGSPNELEEPYLSRETNPRTRKSLDELILNNQ